MDRFLCFSSNISFKYDNFKLKYIMYNVQDYSVLYNNAVRLFICEGCCFTHMRNALA